MVRSFSTLGFAFAALVLALVVLVAGCGTAAPGGSGATTGPASTATSLPAARVGSAGARDPRQAVERFVAIAGRLPPRASIKQRNARLRAACRLLSPDILEGMQFAPSVIADVDRACPPALTLLVYYTGENNDVPEASGFSGRVTGVPRHGDTAVVSVSVSYRVSGGTRRYPTKVLAVRRGGRWWVATPMSLNIRYAAAALGEHQLRAGYRRLVAAARRAHAQHQAGDRATSRIASRFDACPEHGSSHGEDARADVRLSDGMMRSARQPAGADLVAVRHNRDGASLCFEVHFAGAPAAAGEIKFIVLARSQAQSDVPAIWSGGRVTGQRTTDGGDVVAVPVQASRSGDAMTFRLPRSAFGAPPGGYHWGVETFVPIGDEHQAYTDLVPDDQTRSAAGDHLIPQP